MAEYIDREAVCYQLAKQATIDGQPRAIKRAAKIVAGFPAADVRSVVKAKWVYTDKSRLVCSNCGNPVAFALKEDGWHHGDFCPNCGAMMEES